MNRKSFKQILILVALLAVPGFLYYLLQDKGKNRYRPLNIFGPKQVAATFHYKRGKKIADTIYHKISRFELTDLSGNHIIFPHDSTHISVFDFFYTRCYSCGVQNRYMESVVSEYADNKRLQFYSVNIDPGYDSPSKLSAYTKDYKYPPGKWIFLTGDEESVYKLAHGQFLTDVYRDSKYPDSVIHRHLLILVDTQNRIRGFYDALNKEQIDKLKDEIKVLIAEELRKVTDL